MAGLQERPEIRYDAVRPVLTDVRIDPKGAQTLIDSFGVTGRRISRIVVSGQLCIDRGRLVGTERVRVPWATTSRSEYFQVLKKTVSEYKDSLPFLLGGCLPHVSTIYLYSDATLVNEMVLNADLRERSRGKITKSYDEMLIQMQKDMRFQTFRTLIHESHHAVHLYSLKSRLLYFIFPGFMEDDAKSSEADPAYIAIARHAVNVSFPFDRRRMINLIDMTCEYFRQSFRKW